MPTNRTKGVKGVYLELPPDLVEQLKAQARANGRTFRAECEHGLRRHLAAPPAVVTPDMPTADVNGVQPVKRPRGRPRKDKGEGHEPG
jgi:hypothetical protein